MDILLLIFSLSLSDWLAEIIKEMVGDAGWSAVKTGIMKFLGRDIFDKCFDRTIEELMKTYPHYWTQLDIIRDMKVKGIDFPDETSFLDELRRRGVTSRVARFLLDKVATEYRRIILEEARKNEIVFKHVVIGHLTSFHPLLERNTEALERLTNLIEERTRVWDSLSPNTLHSTSLDNIAETLQYYEMRKTVRILNEKGDAIISLFHKCKNGQLPLLSIKKSLWHEGRLILDAVKARINGKRIAPKIVTYVVSRATNSMPIEHKSEIFLDIRPPIPPNESFNHEVVYPIQMLYPTLLKSTSSFHNVLHKTERMSIRIICPQELAFFGEDITFETVDLSGLRAIGEEERLIKMYSPRTRSQNCEIVWKIDKPRLGYKYRIYFKARKRQTTEKDA